MRDDGQTTDEPQPVDHEQVAWAQKNEIDRLERRLLGWQTAALIAIGVIVEEALLRGWWNGPRYVQVGIRTAFIVYLIAVLVMAFRRQKY